jgi:hypothetical protein
MIAKTRRLLIRSAALIVLGGATAGCWTTPPGAGITNPNAGSEVNRDKAAERVDLPVPEASGPGAAIGEVSETPAVAVPDAAKNVSGQTPSDGAANDPASGRKPR